MLHVVCVTLRYTNIKTEFSQTRNVFALNVGARVCIVTDSSFLRVSVHESICHVSGNRGKSQSDILECMFSASFGG